MQKIDLNIKSNLIKKVEFRGTTLYVEEVNGNQFQYTHFDIAGAVAFRDSKNHDEHYIQFIRESTFYPKIQIIKMT